MTGSWFEYIDLPGRGATLGINQFIRDEEQPGFKLDSIYANGRTIETVFENAQRLRDRADFAIDFPGEVVHPDGSLMSRRYVIGSILRRTPDLPNLLIAAEIYPPLEDPAEHEAKLAALHLQMELADTIDKEQIAKTLAVLGMAHALQ